MSQRRLKSTKELCSAKRKQLVEENKYLEVNLFMGFWKNPNDSSCKHRADPKSVVRFDYRENPFVNISAMHLRMNDGRIGSRE